MQYGGSFQVSDIKVGYAGGVGGGDGESIMCQMRGCMIVSYCRWTSTTTMDCI